MTEEATTMDLRDSALKSIVDDVAQIKEQQKAHESKITSLERKDELKEYRINDLSDKLSKIEENTTWLRKTVTGALITAGIGLPFTLVAGVVVWFVTNN
ncbi:hemolysin XhlA family protein [Bacillus sp. JCM 19041]|uniref:hemolysin XhlA family protein n=1 Tax=Bacillus sp. JCM 19041 TaxID=1460637 RepID=UPI0006D02EED